MSGYFNVQDTEETKPTNKLSKFMQQIRAAKSDSCLQTYKDFEPNQWHYQLADHGMQPIAIAAVFGDAEFRNFDQPNKFIKAIIFANQWKREIAKTHHQKLIFEAFGIDPPLLAKGAGKANKEYISQSKTRESLVRELFKTQIAKNIIRDGYGLSLQENIMNGSISTEDDMKKQAHKLIREAQQFQQDRQMIEQNGHPRLKSFARVIQERIDKVTRTGKPSFEQTETPKEE